MSLSASMQAVNDLPKLIRPYGTGMSLSAFMQAVNDLPKFIRPYGPT
jgi:hypothetical protein